MAVERKYLHARSGNGAVPAAAYTLLVPANPKRNWFVVTVPPTEPDGLLLVLCREMPAAGVEFSNIYLATGASAVLSMSGDMPWQGAIWATPVAAADSSCYWSEAEDYP